MSVSTVIDGAPLTLSDEFPVSVPETFSSMRCRRTKGSGARNDPSRDGS